MLAQGFQPQQLPPTLLPAGQLPSWEVNKTHIMLKQLYNTIPPPGVFPPGVDLSQVQGLPPALLGQPFYALGASGYPLVPPRPGNPLPLTVLQQPRPGECRVLPRVTGLTAQALGQNGTLGSLGKPPSELANIRTFKPLSVCPTGLSSLSPVVHTAVSGVPPPGSIPPSQVPQRTGQSQRRAGSPQLGLAKWFGSDVLQQPLPSMPSKVISVDELEFSQ